MAILQAILCAFAFIGSNAGTFDPSDSGTTFLSGSGDLSRMTDVGISWSIVVGATMTTATVTVPEERWFGFAFGVQGMTGAHTIIFNSDAVSAGEIQERDHSSVGAGSVSSTTGWTVDSVTNNVASITYVISRANTVTGLTTFAEADTSVDFIAAMGDATTSYAQHTGANRIMGTLMSATPTAEPTSSPLAPGQTSNPTMDPTGSPVMAPTSSKGEKKGVSMMLMFGIGVASMIAIIL